jgi:hypothetical protein
MTKRRRTLGAADLRRVAVEADTSIEAVVREVAEPGKVQNMVRQRVRRALSKLGIMTIATTSDVR